MRLTPQLANTIAKRLGLSKSDMTPELFACLQEICNLDEKIEQLEAQLRTPPESEASGLTKAINA